MLKKSEGAQRLGVSPQTFDRFVKFHGLPARRLGGHEVFVCEDELEAWLRNRPLVADAPRRGGRRKAVAASDAIDLERDMPLHGDGRVEFFDAPPAAT